MSKTVKYEMYISTLGMLGNLIPISKKVFNETLKNYKEQVEKSNEYELERYKREHPDRDSQDIYYELNINITTTEYKKYIETLYSFHDNGTAICLRKRECKEGYHWK